MFEIRKWALISLIFLVAPAANHAAWGQRSSSKAKPADTAGNDAKKAPEAVEKAPDLGPLQGPMQQSLEAMAGFLKLKSAAESKAKKAIPEETTAELRKQFGIARQALKSAVDTKVALERQPMKDSLLVYASQGLKGMDLVLEGLKKDDQDSRDKGWVFCELALDDLQALNAQAAGKAPVNTAAGEGIGPSMGFNASYGMSTGSSNFNLGALKSWPLTTSIDYGVGVNVGLSSNSSGSGASAVEGKSTSIGVNGFGRYNFLQLFPKQPWIVPFLGAQVGYSSTNSDNTSAGKTSSMSFSSTTYGFQGGALFFFSRQTALNVQVSDDFMPPVSISSPDAGGSPTGSTSATTTSTINISMGLRFSY